MEWNCKLSPTRQASTTISLIVIWRFPEITKRSQFRGIIYERFFVVVFVVVFAVLCRMATVVKTATVRQVDWDSSIKLAASQSVHWLHSTRWLSARDLLVPITVAAAHRWLSSSRWDCTTRPWPTVFPPVTPAPDSDRLFARDSLPPARPLICTLQKYHRNAGSVSTKLNLSYFAVDSYSKFSSSETFVFSQNALEIVWWSDSSWILWKASRAPRLLIGFWERKVWSERTEKRRKGKR